VGFTAWHQRFIVEQMFHLERPVSRQTFSSSLFTVALPLVFGSWLLWLNSTSLDPHVTATSQITYDGLVKTNLVSDGANLYFTEFPGDNSVVAKVPAAGGDVSQVKVALPSVQLLDVSPAHSSLLIAENEVGPEHPFWTYPLNGGTAQRVGDLTGQEAVWSPDGKHVLLVKGSSLLVADAHGEHSRELVTVQGTPYYPRYSPDGKRVRFSVGDVAQNTSSIWEVNSDGSGLHALLPDWHEVSTKCCGSWTADGRYYVFEATEKTLGSNAELFAAAEPASKSGNASIDKPVRLTEGSVSFSRPVPAPDGKRIWALGLDIRGSLVSYDPSSGKYMPFLSGISASDLDFSSDGQWVTYVSIPEGALWRSKIDGSQAQRLTFTSGRAALPKWSPDGTQIAYVNVEEGKPWAIHIVSRDGGAPQPLFEEKLTQIDINWSHDGSKIIFGRITEHRLDGLSILSYDLKTHELSSIPGSQGLFSPRLSPDGRYIAALSGDLERLMLYDTESQKWSQWQTLQSGALNYPLWSSDSKSIYFEDLVSGEGAYCRANVGENHYEHVFLEGNIERHLGPFGLWSGRAPDGSTLFVKEASTREIYELQVDLP
jgi:Tol biopolymer transport system component